MNGTKRHTDTIARWIASLVDAMAGVFDFSGYNAEAEARIRRSDWQAIQGDFAAVFGDLSRAAAEVDRQIVRERRQGDLFDESIPHGKKSSNQAAAVGQY